MTTVSIDKIKEYLETMYAHVEKRPHVYGPLFSAEVAVLAIEHLLKYLSPESQDERSYTKYLGDNDFGACTFSIKFERDHAVFPVYQSRQVQAELEINQQYADQFAEHWANFQQWRKERSAGM